MDVKLLLQKVLTLAHGLKPKSVYVPDKPNRSPGRCRKCNNAMASIIGQRSHAPPCVLSVSILVLPEWQTQHLVAATSWEAEPCVCFGWEESVVGPRVYGRSSFLL